MNGDETGTPPRNRSACASLERWLDEGRPEAGHSAALAHTGTCAACAELLAADLAIETLLAAPAPPAPAALTGAVMDRIERASRARAAVPVATPSALPWWVRAAGEPAAMLAALLAALVAWRGVEAATWLAAASLGLTRWLQAVPSAAPAPFTHPAVLLAIACGAAPAVVWASWRLCRWCERVATTGLAAGPR